MRIGSPCQRWPFFVGVVGLEPTRLLGRSADQLSLTPRVAQLPKQPGRVAADINLGRGLTPRYPLFPKSVPC
jgi:hypothetical protein